MKELDGDLASVPSFAVQKFLMDTFQDLDKDKWLGGQQSGGAFTWVTGDTYLYDHTTCDFSLSSDKLCLKMSAGDNGQWDGEDCASNSIDTYICQKGTSTSQFWNDISGAQFSHMETSCIQSWQTAVNSCVIYGGNIASILSRQILDDLKTVFGSQVPQLH